MHKSSYINDLPQLTAGDIEQEWLLINSEFIIEDISQPFQRTISKSINELTGACFAEIVSPDTWTKLITIIATEHLARKAQYEFFFRVAEQHYIPRTVTLIPIHSSSDDNFFVILVKNRRDDETSSVSLSKKVKDLSEINAALNQHAIVAITDSRGVIIDVNEKFCEVSQYERGELLGHTHKIVSSQLHPRSFFVDMWKTIKKGKVWKGEICNRAKDTSFYWVYTTIVPLFDLNGNIEKYIAVRTDITSRKLAEDKIYEMAFYDELTGLPNRRFIHERIHDSIEKTLKTGQYNALMILDLDHFKEVNDTFGHSLGDELLCQISQRLKEISVINIISGRFGGDEFVVLVQTSQQNFDKALEEIKNIAVKIKDALDFNYKIQKTTIHNTVSIGITLFNLGGITRDDIIKQADIALYRSKKLGRNQFCIFEARFEAELNLKNRKIAELKSASLLKQFELYYQPIVNSVQATIGYEALLRWNHPVHGVITPDQFIPELEETGLIIEVGQWVIEEACRKLALFARQPHLSEIFLTVNVSEKQLHLPNFVNCVVHSLRNSGAAPYLLKLELTESMLHRNVEDTIEKMRQLQKIGVFFALDDFGSGYSSLNILFRLPVNCLKIDKAFICELEKNASLYKIIKLIIGFANSLAIDVIAEGVETKEQLSILNTLGCNLYQGYLFGRPGRLS